MRLISHICSFLLAALVAATAVSAAEHEPANLLPEGPDSGRNGGARIAFHAILVIASDKETTDASLSAYEATLKRVLRFRSYHRVGGGSTSVVDGGEATVAIGQGHSLDLWVTSVTDTEIVYGVRWFKGDRTLANTKVTRPRRSNTVFGGPVVEGGGGHYAVIVTAD